MNVVALTQASRAALAVAVGVVVATVGVATARAESAPALEILAERCVGCHGAQKMGGLDLRNREGLMTGGKRGPALAPGEPRDSLLYRVVSGADGLRMPMGGEPLSAEEVAAIESWIREGAPWGEESLAGAGETWWAFKPPSKAGIPGGAAHPIDAFIGEKLREQELKPLERAARAALARRAYFDLHGLPPTPEQVEMFVRSPPPTPGRS